MDVSQFKADAALSRTEFFHHPVHAHPGAALDDPDVLDVGFMPVRPGFPRRACRDRDQRRVSGGKGECHPLAKELERYRFG